MESRKVMSENRINFASYFSAVELCFLSWRQKDLKSTTISNFLICNEAVSIKYKQFLTQLRDGWFESVLKYNVSSRLKWSLDVFYLRWYFLYVLFSLVLILLTVVWFIPPDRKNIKLAAGNFATSKRERSNVEKAGVKFWGSKGRFRTDERRKVLLFDNKWVST